MWSLFVLVLVALASLARAEGKADPLSLGPDPDNVLGPCTKDCDRQRAIASMRLKQDVEESKAELRKGLQPAKPTAAQFGSLLKRLSNPIKLDLPLVEQQVLGEILSAPRLHQDHLNADKTVARQVMRAARQTISFTQWRTIPTVYPKDARYIRCMLDVEELASTGRRRTAGGNGRKLHAKPGSRHFYNTVQSRLGMPSIDVVASLPVHMMLVMEARRCKIATQVFRLRKKRERQRTQFDRVETAIKKSGSLKEKNSNKLLRQKLVKSIIKTEDKMARKLRKLRTLRRALDSLNVPALAKAGKRARDALDEAKADAGIELRQALNRDGSRLMPARRDEYNSFQNRVQHVFRKRVHDMAKEKFIDWTHRFMARYMQPKSHELVAGQKDQVVEAAVGIGGSNDRAAVYDVEPRSEIVDPKVIQ